MLETYSQIDCDIVDKNKNPKKYRLTEALAHVEGMNQRQATTMIYGNVGTAPVRWLETFSPQPPDENVFRFMAEWDARATELEKTFHAPEPPGGLVPIR